MDPISCTCGNSSLSLKIAKELQGTHKSDVTIYRSNGEFYIEVGSVREALSDKGYIPYLIIRSTGDIKYLEESSCV